MCLWQAGRHRAELVNAPGSWNWSDLRTDDFEGAKAFYGAVFGWETTDLEFGATTATMWRRPGYGEVLAEREPGNRERQAEAGAPAGFEDAIGWLLPLDDGAAPHWAVTFAVDGTDAVVASAAELGATVLTAPYDAGRARVAVLRDPQGADFTVSTYAPPGVTQRRPRAACAWRLRRRCFPTTCSAISPRPRCPTSRNGVTGAYRRTLRLPHGGAVAALAPRGDHIACRLTLADERDLGSGGRGLCIPRLPQIPA